MGCCGRVCPVSDGAGPSDKTACEASRIECLAVEGDGPVAVCVSSRYHSLPK